MARPLTCLFPPTVEFFLGPLGSLLHANLAENKNTRVDPGAASTRIRSFFPSQDLHNTGSLALPLDTRHWLEPGSSRAPPQEQELAGWDKPGSPIASSLNGPPLGCDTITISVSPSVPSAAHPSYPSWPSSVLPLLANGVCVCACVQLTFCARGARVNKSEFGSVCLGLCTHLQDWTTECLHHKHASYPHLAPPAKVTKKNYIARVPAQPPSSTRGKQHPRNLIGGA